MEESGLIFNIQKFSIHDGPGIRTTVFLKGCPLRCHWCHNPEGICSERELMFWIERCQQCSQCSKLCSQGAISLTGKGLAYERERCNLCTACVEGCPFQAWEVAGRLVSAAEVMAEVLKDTVFYDESLGGVTFSGGEPLGQPEFLETLLKACRQHSIHTAVDTTGFAAFEHLARIAPLTDLFLYDIKLLDDSLHLRYTGQSNRLIIDNLRRLREMHESIIIRVPVIPTVNDDREHVLAVAKLMRELALHEIELIPYHSYAIEKYTRLGRVYEMPEVAPTPQERICHLKALLECQGLRVSTS